MNNKRILNLTSRKKRDTMLVMSRGGSTGTATKAAFQMTPNPYGLTNAFLWCATARDMSLTNPGGFATIRDEASRTSSTCYMRGLSETIEIQTNSATPWQWRRICFTIRDPTIFTVGTPYQPYLETSNGYSRLLYNLAYENATDQSVLEGIREVVFKGQLGVDWDEYITAPVDTRRVTLKSDRTTIIRSSNDVGILRRDKRWYPMNKNLVYDDDESGGGTLPQNVYSTSGKAGMGDYYILDFFRAGLNSQTTDRLSLNISSSLYWHEK